MAGTIQGTFGWSNEPLIAGMADAERVATRGAANVQNKFLSIFKRSPNMRAERAFQGLAQSLATGDIAGGIESITNRLTGMGLVAGVAIGAGVAIISKFREQILATTEAEKKLGTELALLGGIRGPEELAKQFSAISAATDELVNKSKTIGTTVGDFLSKVGDPFTGAGAKDPEKARAAEIKNSFEDQIKLLGKRAEVEQQIVGIKENQVKFGEHETVLAKLSLDASIKKAAIDEESKRYKLSLFGKVDPDTLGRLVTANQASASIRKTVIDREAIVAADAEDKRADAKERSLVIEEKMARLIRGGLKPEEQKGVRSSLEIQSIDQQLAATKDPEVRRNLLLQKAQKENELRGTGTDQRNPFPFGTAANRNFESEQGGFGTIAARSKETEDAASFGTLARSAADRGELPERKQQAPEVVAAINATNTLLKKIFLTPAESDKK